MYCIKCGVELAAGEKQCPLCKTKVYHPDLPLEEGESLFPKGKKPAVRKGFSHSQFLMTAAFLLPMLICFLSDLQFGNGVTWSGYVIGGLALIYVIFVLPAWFRKYYPVIFVPCNFVAAGLYLLYIDLCTHGGWFLSFAFPVTGGVALIVTAVVTLSVYLRRGKLYVYGGAFVALGAFMLLVEFLMDVTFPTFDFMGWSFYPLATLALVGLLLIFLAICRPARETMERKFFF